VESPSISPLSSLGEEKGPIKASPRAKAMAAERGIDLSTLKGSGPGGRIIEEDVIKAGAASVPRATGATDRPLSQMRKAIARTTTQSKAPVPHFYLTAEIAMEEAEQLRAQLKQSRRSHPSLTDMIVKAAALALTRHPEINVSYAGDVLRQHGSIDIGIAVGLDDGLIAPVLRDCGAKTLEDIATESRGLIERARNKRLQPHEYTGATFSVSNLGMFDVENFIAVIMPPGPEREALQAHLERQNALVVVADTVDQFLSARHEESSFTLGVLDFGVRDRAYPEDRRDLVLRIKESWPRMQLAL